MTASNTPSYDALAARQLQLHRLGHLQALATWDRMTFMPSGAASARGGAQAELAALMQEMRNDPALESHFGHASGEPLGDVERRNLDWMERERLLARAVPPALVDRLTTLQQAAGAAWRPARERNDWNGFATALGPLVTAVREQAARLGDALGTSSYDALIDQHEPGARHARIAPLFAEVASWLPPLMHAAIERQRLRPPLAPVGPFAIDSQRELCERVVAALGFDFERGRLDVSAHPFTGGVPEDVRMTTRFSEAAFLPALIGAIHETGHACYQQHLPRQWPGQPVAGPCSASMHEGQALTFERQLAPMPAFADFLAPLLRKSFGAQPAFEPANLVALMTRVEPGRIRVAADELTYPAHVILRVEIEAALMGGDLEVDDIPAAWDERMRRLLGIDTHGHYASGPLQDVHWSQGMFGYFPAYLLGAMIAAQCMEALRRACPDLDARVAAGDLSPAGAWLDERIWRQGARYDSDELLRRATGRPLEAGPLRRHFERRYGAAPSSERGSGLRSR